MKSEIELLWKGKGEPIYPNKVIDIPYSENNLLIKGDNLDIIHSLMDSYKGKINLIYIDPPFMVGKDFKNKEGELAYSDKWDSVDEFLCFMYERLKLMRDLLADDGSIYVHCDYRMNSYLRLIMDEIFGKGGANGIPGFRNEIAWCYTGGRVPKVAYGRRHDTIYFYTKANNWTYNYKSVMAPLDEKQVARYKYEDQYGRYRLIGRFFKNSPIKGSRDISPKWEETHPELVMRYYMKEGTLRLDYWTDIDQLNQNASDRTGYNTQKPEALLERIIKASSNEGDLVADFFCGSGTTGAVAEKLGRKWLMADQSDLAIKTTSKRLKEKLNTEFKYLEV